MGATRRYRVTGRVQGVGYRAFVWRHAVRLGLIGWVRNCSDGTVELLVTASEDRHEELLSVLHEGPRWSRVDRIDVSDAGTGEAAGGGFAIRADS